jgi:hypothetical protein
VDLTPTRTALHGIAELLLAGPQHAESDTVRLRVVPGGVATTRSPDLRLDGTEVVGPAGRVPLRGTFRDVATAVGVIPQELGHVYADRAAVSAHDEIVVDPAHLQVLLDALAVGDAALRSFAPSATPVLWPEHLDVAITVDEVNYGVSPGDAAIAEPYAYVGPWAPRRGDFWNVSFGAARPLTELGDADAVVSFFREGSGLAVSDPPAG